MKTTQQYKSLFSPFKINELEFKNRILLAPMGDNLCNKDGSISKKQEGYLPVRKPENNCQEVSTPPNKTSY